MLRHPSSCTMLLSPLHSPSTLFLLLSWVSIWLWCLVPWQGCAAWERVFSVAGSMPTPVSRHGHSFGRWDDDRFVLFGGHTTTMRESIPASPPTMGGDCGGALHFCYGRGTCARNASCVCNDGYFGASCEIVEVTTFLDDLWVFRVSNSSWTQIVKPLSATTSATAIATTPWPAARYFHSGVVVGNTLVVYSGYSQLCEDYCDEIWEFDLASAWAQNDGNRAFWVKTASSLDPGPGPGPRWRHAYSRYIGISGNGTAQTRMLVHGGHRLDEALGDIWVYMHDSAPGLRWSQIVPISSSSEPKKRFGHALAMDGSQFYIFGGYRPLANTTANLRMPGSLFFLDDMWRFDMAARSWTLVEPALPDGAIFGRLHAQMIRIEHDVLLLFGGYRDNVYYGDSWIYNATRARWFRHHDDPSVEVRPASRASHVLVQSEGSGDILLYGGWGVPSERQKFAETELEEHYADMWRFAPQSCVDDCSQRGRCDITYCYCEDYAFGEHCQDIQCPSSLCTYDIGGTQRPTCTHCSGRGECVYGLCLCRLGFSGVGCEIAECPANCSSHGACTTSAPGQQPRCKCDFEYIGESCETLRCLNNCNNNGICTTQRQCQCNVLPNGYYDGADCRDFVSSAARAFTATIIHVVVLLSVLILAMVDSNAAEAMY